MLLLPLLLGLVFFGQGEGEVQAQPTLPAQTPLSFSFIPASMAGFGTTGGADVTSLPVGELPDLPSLVAETELAFVNVAKGQQTLFSQLQNDVHLTTEVNQALHDIDLVTASEAVRDAAVELIAARANLHYNVLQTVGYAMGVTAYFLQGAGYMAEVNPSSLAMEKALKNLRQAQDPLFPLSEQITTAREVWWTNTTRTITGLQTTHISFSGSTFQERFIQVQLDRGMMAAGTESFKKRSIDSLTTQSNSYITTLSDGTISHWTQLNNNSLTHQESGTLFRRLVF